MNEARTTKVVGIALALALATGAAGCGKDAEAVAPKAPAVTEASGRGEALRLPERAEGKNKVGTAKARRTKLSADLDLVGSVSASEDHFALVGPLVGGRVARVLVGLGDEVRRGQVLAELESAEVGQAQADYLAALARAESAEAQLRRETELAAKKISPEREREVAHATALQERANVRAAEQRLRAFGLQAADIAPLKAPNAVVGRIPMRAPIGGTVIGRMVTLGQAVERGTDAFKLADLRSLWVLLDLYEKDLTHVHVGQKVALRTEAHRGETFAGTVANIEPVIDHDTRTAKVRIELDNRAGKLRLGQLVTAHLSGDVRFSRSEVIAVPRTAVQRVEGKTIVFARSAEGFVRKPVTIGASSGEWIEIERGVAEGEEVATDGAFLLKSELLR